MGVSANKVLAVQAFLLRQLGNLGGGEPAQFYNTLNGCGFIREFDIDAVVGVLNCARSQLGETSFQPLGKRLESVLFFGEALLGLEDSLTVDLGHGLDLQLNYRNPPADPP